MKNVSVAQTMDGHVLRWPGQIIQTRRTRELMVKLNDLAQ